MRMVGGTKCKAYNNLQISKRQNPHNHPKSYNRTHKKAEMFREKWKKTQETQLPPRKSGSDINLGEKTMKNTYELLQIGRRELGLTSVSCGDALFNISPFESGKLGVMGLETIVKRRDSWNKIEVLVLNESENLNKES